MLNTYIATSLDGTIVIFTSDETEVVIKIGSRFTDGEVHYKLSQWAEDKAAYGDRNDLVKYEDHINAAWHCLSLNFGSLNRDSVKKSEMEVGMYFPRIWRGIHSHDSLSTYNVISPRRIYKNKYIDSVVATSIVYEEMTNLFRYIEPRNKNNSSFGHKIRELLIISCTEIETMWRSILEENGYLEKDRYSTNDYCKLIQPMRLKDWSVFLSDYPDFGELSPFSSWDEASSTKSLIWYDAYNAVKHHREGHFEQASLINLVNAVAALHIMQSAQWGADMYDRYHGNEKSPFTTSKFPEYDISEVYIENFGSNDALLPKSFFTA